MKAIGVDVGGTSVKLGLVQDGLEVVFRDQRPTPRTLEEIVLLIYEMVSAAWTHAPGAPAGISFAGTLDGEGCVTANQLGLVKAPVRQRLLERFGMALPVENDAVCALTAEHRYGALRGCETGILLTLGTGIGGGLILAGQPARGFQGLHGELGHMITHLDGRACSCGQRGCWEQYAAARALRQMAEPLTVEELVGQVRAGGRSEVWDSYIHEVAGGIQSLMMVFMPEVIAIGGGLSNAGSVLVDAVRAAVEQTSAYKKYCPFTRIVQAHFRNDAGVIGAAALTRATA